MLFWYKYVLNLVFLMWESFIKLSTSLCYQKQRLKDHSTFYYIYVVLESSGNSLCLGILLLTLWVHFNSFFNIFWWIITLYEYLLNKSTNGKMQQNFWDLRQAQPKGWHGVLRSHPLLPNSQRTTPHYMVPLTLSRSCFEWAKGRALRSHDFDASFLPNFKIKQNDKTLKNKETLLGVCTHVEILLVQRFVRWLYYFCFSDSFVIYVCMC